MPKVREKLFRKAANVKKKAIDGIYEYTRKNFGKIFAGELLGSARDNFVTSFSIKGHSIKSLLEFKFASADVMDITVQEECC